MPSSWWKQCPSSSSLSCSGCQGALGGFCCNHPLLPHNSNNCHHYNEDYNIIKKQCDTTMTLFVLPDLTEVSGGASSSDRKGTNNQVCHLPLVKLVATIGPTSKEAPPQTICTMNEVVYMHCRTVCQATHIGC